MAIVKNSFGVSKPSTLNISPGSAMSGDDSETSGGFSEEEEDEEEVLSASESGSDSDDSDADSGMGSDGYDSPAPLDGPAEERCQLGNQSFSLPLELYDLPGLGDILSLETWNDCLTEEERFALAEFLPDMDQETFTKTMKELLGGENIQFGNPVMNLFNQLKGGLFDPHVEAYRRGLDFLQRRVHRHRLREYHDLMVGLLHRVKGVWESCHAYGVEEKIRIANSVRREGLVDRELALANEVSEEGMWGKKIRNHPMGMDAGNRAVYTLKQPSLEDPVRVRSAVALEPAKGILKVIPSKKPMLSSHGVELKLLSKSRYSKQFNSGRVGRSDRGPMGGEDGMEEFGRYDMGVQKDHRKPWMKQEFMRRHATDGDGIPMGFPLPLKGERFHPYDGPVHYRSQDGLMRRKYLEKDQTQHVLSRARGDYGGGSPVRFDDWNTKSKKLRAGEEFQSEKNMNFNKSQRIYTPKTPDLYLDSDRKSKLVQEKFIRNSTQDGMSDTRVMQNFSSFARGEETESDSSEHADEEVDASPLMRKSGHQKPYSVKAVYDQKKFQQVKKEKEVVDVNGRFRFPESERFSAKGKFKGKASNQAGYLHDLHKVSSKLMKNNDSQMPFLRGYSAEKNFKWKPDLDYPVSKSNYVHDYASGVLDGEEDLLMNSRSMDKSGSGSQFKEAVAIKAEHHERTDVPLVVCNSRTKKRKGKVDGAYIDDTTEPDYVESSSKKQNNEPKLMKKGGKKKVEPGSSPLPLVNTDPLVPERGSADLETETKPLKKSFIPITPTVHTGFSFSIIHLLTSIRKAMITVQAEDVAEASGLPDKNNGNERHQTINGVLPPDKLDANSSEQTANKNLPSLAVQQIVTRVRSDPGDPSILHMQEPLHDLVRGVLKIFSSKTAPLGAKGWKPLVVYEKSTKSWSWIGPFSSRSDHDLSEEETSSDAWGIPHKMLVKLVDAFANWLKSGQETLRQIGTLPAPPVCLHPCLSEKERFRDLRAQKSLNTISPSTDEMRAYFRREEVLRYSIPDRAFSYTAADGKKSIVAPLRRCGGKPTSKARDHFMLKPDRPPHVTILCLVRDAAARLPGNIGTRADVCTLIRDSQYIVEDVTDAQVNQVVSGALDRLHYEIDPCVQYDSDRKLWVYLHRDREEEDFEDDGTSSTKKWKRQRKDPTETSEVGKINDNGPGDQPVGESATGYEFNPDLNVEASTIYGGENAEPSYNDAKPNIEEPYISSGQGNAHQEHPMGWGVLDLNSFRETKMLCQENSTNEDFDDETYGREQAAGVMTAGL